MPDFRLEAAAGGPVAGIDEAGRGPWAGPVVAAAVVFERRPPRSLARLIDDSKVLRRAQREDAFAALTGAARIGVGIASVEEIDRLNILQATLTAMRRAVDALMETNGPVAPVLALVDGNVLPVLPCPVKAVIGGDGLSLSIAAASIVAKVSRDRLMTALADEYPGYGWRTNVGYGTPEHRAALLNLGPCRHHRTSFRPVREAAAGLPGL
ncbi:MAG: ribonuclease HII [Rhodospirillales bacterium]